MNKLLLVSMILMSVPIMAQETRPTIDNGAVGVVYFVKDSPNSIDVNLVFTGFEVKDYPENFPADGDYKSTATVFANGYVTLFDAKGILATIKSPSRFVLKSWCENDSGLQFRPEAHISIAKSDLRRSLVAVEAIQNIAAFAYLSSSKESPKANPIVSQGDVRLRGDRDGDGKADALISVAQDDAGNCDGKPDNNLTINLKTEKFGHPLRCCGP